MRLFKVLAYSYIKGFIPVMWMANPQTTETTTQVLYGAVKIEVSSSSDFSGAVDIGAVNGAKYTEEMKISTV